MATTAEKLNAEIDNLVSWARVHDLEGELVAALRSMVMPPTKSRVLAATAATVPVGIVSSIKNWALQRGFDVQEALDLVGAAVTVAMATPGAGVRVPVLSAADRELCRRAGVDPGKVAATIAAGKAGAR